MKLINTEYFPLQGTFNRFYHLATVHSGLREYVCFEDRQTHKMYIEEAVGCHFEAIEDDVLFQELYDFLVDKGILRIGKI